MLAAVIGWRYAAMGRVSFFLIAGCWRCWKISLSFDNAIVNANKLKQMTPKWQRRSDNGVIIAVFGIGWSFRFLVVVIAAKLGPWEACVWAAASRRNIPASSRGAPAHRGLRRLVPDAGGAELLLRSKQGCGLDRRDRALPAQAGRNCGMKSALC